MLEKIGSIVQIWPVEGASCKFKGTCTECIADKDHTVSSKFQF